MRTKEQSRVDEPDDRGNNNNMDRYEVKKKIGQGSFGNVYLTVHRKSRQTVVLKEVKVSRMSHKERQDVAHEVELLSKLSHRNLVQYMDSFSDNIGCVSIRSFYIVMEYCDGGDLYMKIDRQRGRLLPENVILTYFVQLCRAVQYIHERKILHRDIKSQNIFLYGSPGNQRMIKLGDFGIAKIMDGTAEYAKTCIGTPFYLSPEVWENKPYSNKSDIWAMGCVLYELTTLRHAFEAGCLKNLMLRILRGSYPAIPSKYSNDIRILINKMLQKNPLDRPSLNAILRKKIIQKVENDLNRPKTYVVEQRIRLAQTKRAEKLYNRKSSKTARTRTAEQPEQGSAYRPRPSFKRQNPFIQLLTEGKKLRENARDKEWSDEEYLAKLKEIRQMNAKEKRLLYEKYGRARSSLAKVEMEAAKIKSGNGNTAAAATTSAVAVCFDLFSDILNSNSGRKTVNSDTYIMTDLKNEEIIKSDSDDDHDVTIIPPIKSRALVCKSRLNSVSNGSSGYKSGEDDIAVPEIGTIPRRMSILESLRNFICIGHTQNSIVLENESPQKSTKSEDIILNMLRPDEEQINTTGINGNALVPYVQVEEANFQYPQLEYIPEVEEFVDMSPDDQEPIADYFKFLSRSFSLPNLTFTPLESLLPTEDEMLEAALDYTDDTNFEPISPVKNVDENAMWHMESTSNIPDDPTLHSTDIFAYLETQRAILEEKIGVKALLRVYKMISKLEHSTGDEKIDYTTLTKVLGKGNEDLIDDIIQLVVADQFFH